MKNFILEIFIAEARYIFLKTILIEKIEGKEDQVADNTHVSTIAGTMGSIPDTVTIFRHAEEDTIHIV